jgi:hypothetical protein
MRRMIYIFKRYFIHPLSFAFDPVLAGEIVWLYAEYNLTDIPHQDFQTAA